LTPIVKNGLQEKLYLHIDRPVYACGETMWFKIYNVDGTLHHPLGISKIAYVEVLDGSQSPVLQAKVALSDGKGNGSFELPATLNSGNYTVRAYTNWMKNFNPAFYFEQPVSIINTFKEPRTLTAASDGELRPSVLSGRRQPASRCSKLRSPLRLSTRQAAKVFHFRRCFWMRKGDSIAALKPHKFGIGHFTFTPEAGKKYKARVTAGRWEDYRANSAKSIRARLFHAGGGCT
jgi:hypothetical protein